MLFTLLSSALAADAPVALQGNGLEFEAVDHRGRTVNPYQFADHVGDHATLELYRRNMGLARGAGMVGWVGGGACMGLGAGTALVGAIVAEGDLVAAGGLFFGAGFTALAVGTVGFVAGRTHYNRMSTWYLPSEAEAWMDQARVEAALPQAPPELSLAWTGNGLESRYGEEKLTAELFARQVGDMETWRRARLWKWANTAAGIGLLGAGHLMVAMSSGAGDARASGAVAGTGVLTAGTGVLVLTLGRKLYTDMDTWYTRREAETWLEGGP